ncbi:hypothetical protein [Microbacterium sp. PA5]|uniref:hypothetical protein n=1 Tax=Microbacterium sp. PA5 TaxID=3416654 RepID=UPI003CF50F4D
MPTRERLSAAGGLVLRALFAALAAVRRPRPIHPRGVALVGTATWIGASQSGIRWVDDPPPSPQQVTARVSRSAGFPAPLPDVIGLALRFRTDEVPADLELASTGAGVPGRFALLLHGSPSRAHLGTLLPYTGDRGPVLLAARTVTPTDLPTALPALGARLRQEPWRLRLFVATPRGAWHPFADLELRSAGLPSDTADRFDAGRRLLPGARMPPWVRALRQPSYDAVQRDR